MKFRNPWGHYSWRGDWSDDSKLWTDDLRDILMPHGGSEGVFWISFEDVLKYDRTFLCQILIGSCFNVFFDLIFRYFDCIDICKVRSGWNEVRLQGTLQPLCSLSCVLLTVLEPTEAEFTLFQEGQRNSEKSQRSQLDLCVVIFRTRSLANPEVGRLVEHSKRQVSRRMSIFPEIFHSFLSIFRVINQISNINICSTFLGSWLCWLP